MTFLGLYAIFASLLCVFAWRLLHLSYQEVRELKEERRKLQYEVMQACVALYAERDRAISRHNRYRAYRTAAAVEIAELKKGVEEALDLLAAYHKMGGTPIVTPLPVLRDRLSEFGREMGEVPTSPADLTDGAEWAGFK